MHLTHLCLPDGHPLPLSSPEVTTGTGLCVVISFYLEHVDMKSPIFKERSSRHKELRLQISVRYKEQLVECKGRWQRRATFPGALKEYIGLLSENTLAEDRRMDQLTSEIQPGLCRTQGWSTPPPHGKPLWQPFSFACHLVVVTTWAFVSTAPMLWVVWFSQHLWGFCKERKLCVYSGVGGYQLIFGKGTKLLVTPSKFFFLANYSSQDACLPSCRSCQNTGGVFFAWFVLGGSWYQLENKAINAHIPWGIVLGF